MGSHSLKSPNQTNQPTEKTKNQPKKIKTTGKKNQQLKQQQQQHKNNQSHKVNWKVPGGEKEKNIQKGKTPLTPKCRLLNLYRKDQRA